MDPAYREEIIGQIIEKISLAKDIAIAGHISPDGDAVASCLALARGISKQNKNPVVLLESFPKRYSFIGMQECIRYDGYDGFSPDLFICLDCGTKGRMGQAEPVFDRSAHTIVIDHHASNNHYGGLNYVDPKASSTSEMVFDILDLMGLMDQEIASAIYTGIIFDTGGLRFGSTSPETMRKVACLMEHGVPFTEIYTKTMLAHSYEEAMVFSVVTGKMRFYKDLPLVYSSVSLAEMESCNAGKEDLEGIVEYMLNTKGADMSVFVYQTGERTSKVSFRSINADVNEIAKNWGGGGHVNASGAAMNLAPDEALGELLPYIEKRLATVKK